MVFQEGAIILTGIGILGGIFKTIDYMVRKRNDKELINKLDGNYNKIDKVHNTLHKMYDMHDKYDDDGTPLWYVPRTYHITQEKIITICESISHVLEKLSLTQENIVKQLDKLSDKLTK